MCILYHSYLYTGCGHVLFSWDVPAWHRMVKEQCEDEIGNGICQQPCIDYTASRVGIKMREMCPTCQPPKSFDRAPSPTYSDPDDKPPYSATSEAYADAYARARARYDAEMAAEASQKEAEKAQAIAERRARAEAAAADRAAVAASNPPPLFPLSAEENAVLKRFLPEGLTMLPGMQDLRCLEDVRNYCRQGSSSSSSSAPAPAPNQGEGQGGPSSNNSSKPNQKQT